MALKASEKTGVNEYTLTITIDGEKFESAVVKVYNKQKNKINVPGFRKGKAPRTYIEKLYGTGVFYEDALDDIFPEVYSEALEASGVDAVSAPFDFDVAQIGKDGVEFSVKVSSKPEIVLGEYKGMEAEKTEPAPVADEDIDAEIAKMQEENSRLIDIDDRAAQNDDIANIDFEGFVDGVAFDGGKGEGYDLTLGSGTFVPGFEDQIAGHNAGDKFDVNVTFPEQYVEDLAGKEAVFKVTLNSIKVKELPEIDDDFAKDVSEFDTVTELRDDIKKNLEENRKKASDSAFESAVLLKLAELVDAEIPEAMVESAIDKNLREFEYRLNMQGMDLKTYAQYFGGDVSVLRDQYRDKSEKDVRIDLALEKIIKDENIEVSEDDINAEYDKVADMYKMELEEVKKAIPEADLKEELAMRKAVEFVVAGATPVAPKKEEEAEKEEAPAEKPKRTRKTTAKKTTKKSAEEKTEDKAEENSDAE